MGKMRDSDWSRKILLRSDWLVLLGATITTRVTTGDRRSHDRDRQQAGSRQLCVHKRSFHFIASHTGVLFEAPPQFPSLCPERSLLKAPCDQNIERGGGGEMHKLQSPNYCLKSRFPGTVSVKFMIDPGCKQIYVKHRIF